MSPRSPICVSTAQPSDSGTLHRGRTISPAERHRHLRRNNAVLLHRSRSVEREVKNLHKEYRKAVVQARNYFQAAEQSCFALPFFRDPVEVRPRQ